MERISSPEQLTDYLRVTNPGIWVILTAVLLILIALMAWSTVGTLETTADAKAVVRNNAVQAVVTGSEYGEIKSGMPMRVASQECIVSSIDADEYGRTVAHAQVSLPDGAYDAEIIVERIHPIRFLLESR